MSMISHPKDSRRGRNQAELLLFRLATHLLRLPFEGRTRMLHIRALELKRVVDEWDDLKPSASQRRAVCDEIVNLQRAAARWRDLPPTDSMEAGPHD